MDIEPSDYQQCTTVMMQSAGMDYGFEDRMFEAKPRPSRGQVEACKQSYSPVRK